MYDLSIIIPCYNEAKNISNLLEKLDSINKKGVEIVLVNNGSTDETKEIISNQVEKDYSQIKFINIKRNIGYGHGIMTGIQNSSGAVVAWTHADLQTDTIDVLNAYHIFIEEEKDKKVILKGKRIGRNIFDAFFTFGMSLISSTLMGVKLNDINAQPKMFHREFLDKFNNAPNDFSLDLYFLYLARINNYEILEYPVQFGRRIYGESKGGGTIMGKLRLINRTWAYINELRKNKHGH